MNIFSFHATAKQADREYRTGEFIRHVKNK